MEENHKSRIAIIKAALIIGFPIILLFAYNYSSTSFNIELKKAYPIENGKLVPRKKGGSNPLTNPNGPKKHKPTNGLSATEAIKRSLTVTDKTAPDIKPIYATDKNDTTGERVLLIGDSEAGGLRYPLNDYCNQNGHQFVASLEWNSSTILNFGYSEKVDILIDEYKPTFIIFVVGLNELFATDLSAREKAAQKFRDKLGNIEFLWVGPANFDEDKGINDVFKKVAGEDRFFMSKELVLPRGKDKRHPSVKGYKLWMTSIANFIQTNPVYPFKFDPPEKSGIPMRGKVMSANAAKDRGY